MEFDYSEGQIIGPVTEHEHSKKPGCKRVRLLKPDTI